MTHLPQVALASHELLIGAEHLEAAAEVHEAGVDLRGLLQRLAGVACLARALGAGEVDDHQLGSARAVLQQHAVANGSNHARLIFPYIYNRHVRAWTSTCSPAAVLAPQSIFIVTIE